MSKITKSFRVDDMTTMKLKEIQELLEEHYQEKIGMGKVLDLVVDIINSNIDINTILLHYSVVKDTLLADGRKTRENNMQN